MVGIIVVNFEGIFLRMDLDNFNIFLYVFLCKVFVLMVNNIVWDIDLENELIILWVKLKKNELIILFWDDYLLIVI